MTVLAIDDDPIQIELLRALCGRLEYPIIEFLAAGTVKAGLAAARESVVDLVFADLHLPDGTGFDLLRELKAMNPTISVVIITAFEDTREAAQLLKAKADDYLIKPFRKDDIERLLIRMNETAALTHESLLPPAEGLDRKSVV